MMTEGAIVVLGMHRSGTSALAGALAQLGAVPPHDAMPADGFNAKGYFEPLSAVRLNDRLLGRFGRSWSDFRVVPDTYLDAAADAVADMAEALSASYVVKGPRILKDPRICLLMPLWDEALRQNSIDAVFLIPIRNPAEVAASLVRRDQMAPVAAEALWVRSMIEAERQTRGRTRAFLPINLLLEDPVGAFVRLENQLGVSWPHSPESRRKELRSFVNRKLMTPARAVASPLSELSSEIHRTLQELSIGTNDMNAMARLDHLAAAFEYVCEPLAQLLHIAPHAAARVTLIENLRSQLKKELQSQSPGAEEALRVVELLPLLSSEPMLWALTEDVDDLVRKLSTLQSHPFEGLGRFTSHVILRWLEVFAPLLPLRRAARLRRSREKRDPRRHGREWSKIRDALTASSYAAGLHEKPQRFATRVGGSKMAVAIHAFYPDIFDEILLRFGQVSRDITSFYITCPVGMKDQLRLICEAHGRSAEIYEVVNRGRDVLPFLTILPHIQAAKHETILKLHTKKSLHHSNGRLWRSAIFSELITPDKIAQALNAFEAEPKLGIIAPRGHILDLATFIDTNRPCLESLLDRASISHESLDKSVFVAGTMMFIRSALAVEISEIVDPFAFEPEIGQTEGTLAHAVERFFAVHASARGFQTWSTEMEEIRNGDRAYDYVQAYPLFHHTRRIMSASG